MAVVAVRPGADPAADVDAVRREVLLALHDPVAHRVAGVPDVEAALAQAESLGGTRTMGPDEVMEGTVIGLFRDPEGHTVGVVSG